MMRHVGGVGGLRLAVHSGLVHLYVAIPFADGCFLF